MKQPTSVSLGVPNMLMPQDGRIQSKEHSALIATSISSLPSFSLSMKQKGRTVSLQAIPLACSPGPRSYLHHHLPPTPKLSQAHQRSLSVLRMQRLSFPLCLACCLPGSVTCLSVCPHVQLSAFTPSSALHSPPLPQQTSFTQDLLHGVTSQRYTLAQAHQR